MNKPIQNDDKLIEQLEAENKALEYVFYELIVDNKLFVQNSCLQVCVEKCR